MISIQAIDFSEQFRKEYNRNNRKSGQKSLRCFPLCLASGHSDSGFCGRAVAVTVTCSGKIFHLLDHLTFAGEVHRSGSDDTILNRFRQGHTRYGDFRSTPQYKGWFGIIDNCTYDAESDTTKLSVFFNKGRHSWDYEWKSNRWTGSETNHVFTVSVLQSCDQVLQLLKSRSSTEFIVSCSHKTPSSRSSNYSNASVTGEFVSVAPKNQKRQREESISSSSYSYDEYYGKDDKSSDFCFDTRKRSYSGISTIQSSNSLNSLSSLNLSSLLKVDESSDKSTKYDEQSQFSSNTGVSSISSDESDSDDLEDSNAKKFARLMSLVNHSCYLFDIQRRLDIASQSYVHSNQL